MGLADSVNAPISMTDAEKDGRAALRVKGTLAESVRMARRAIDGLKGAAAEAPGGKAAILSCLGDHADEAQEIVGKLLAIANAHKRTGDPDVSF